MTDFMYPELREKIATAVRAAFKDPQRDRSNYLWLVDNPKPGDHWETQFARAEEFVRNEMSERTAHRDSEVEDVLADAADLSVQCEDDEIIELFTRLHRVNASKSIIKSLSEIVVETTPLGKREVNALAKRAMSKVPPDDAEAGTQGMCVQTTGIDDRYAYTCECIIAANGDAPRLFTASGEMVRLKLDDASGTLGTLALNQDEQLYETDEVMYFYKLVGDEANPVALKVAPPNDVMSKLRGSYTEFLPQISGIATTPVFVGDGRLVEIEGYDGPSELYLSLGAGISNIDVPGVVSEADVEAAKSTLIVEALGDFRFDGQSRDELVRTPDQNDSLKNAIVMLLQPCVMPMIRGPRPAWVITKPTKGSGASLLTSLYHIVGTGQRGAPRAYPAKDEEFNKEIVGELRRKAQNVWYDNVKGSISGPTLELILTATHFSGRILGGNASFSGPVTAQLIFTCNNASLSSDMMRRCMKIVIDTLNADPTKRTDFRHPNLLDWATKNRAKLVRACIVLVKNWIAKGSPRQTSNLLASFEEWHGVMGGILEAAGLGPLNPDNQFAQGYFDNADDADDEHLAFIELWYAQHGSDLAPTNSPAGEWSNDTSLTGIAVSNALFSVYKNEDRPQTGTTIRSKLKNRVFDLSTGETVRVVQPGDRVGNSRGWKLERVTKPKSSSS